MAGDFFCGIGVQKAGTTWLAHYLKNMPAVYMPPVKELQIFSRLYRADIFGWMDGHFQAGLSKNISKLLAGKPIDPSIITTMAEMLAIPQYKTTHEILKNYRQLFRGRTGDTLAFGEFSTTYCLLPAQGFSMLNAAYPEGKIILVLRDPVARYWSHLKHRKRFEPEFDVERNFEKLLNDQEYGAASDYRSMYTLLTKSINRDRVHVAFYEDFFIEKNLESLRAVTQFLRLDFEKPDFEKIVYAGLEGELPPNLALLAKSRFLDSYAFVKELTGRLPTGWANDFI